jgi:NAD(P)-dependent dehydrogenase (short-subunit alcohol dehydrogenase family)
MGSQPKIWFVTGISRGLGQSLAEALLARGAIVIGTTRSGKAAIAGDAGRLHVLPLEVTDPAAVRQAVEAAFALHGRIDVVVNNAGYGLLGAVEEASEDQVAHLFDVNFHGPRRIIQAALPRLRAQRSGHIVNVTSVAGIAPGAGSGMYAAAKMAVEGMSQSLAREVGPLGIRVTLVEPGAFRTDFLSEHSIRHTSGGIADYDATAGATRRRLAANAGRQAGDPARGAAAIIAAVESASPPLHLVLGPDAIRRTHEMLDAFAADLAAWEAVGLGTDHDSAAA